MDDVAPKVRTYNLWVLAYPAEDVPGQWVAHCLDLDVVSQGNSLDHALKMVGEAMRMVVVDDLARNEDPLLRRAPAGCWDQLWMVTNNPRAMRGPLDELVKRQDQLAFLAAQMTLTVTTAIAQHAPVSRRPGRQIDGWDMPLVFAKPERESLTC